MSLPLFIIGQIEHTHPLWHNAFFYISIVLFIVFGILTFIMMKVYRKRTEDNRLTQQQHAARIDNIRKEHTETLEKMRQEMLKREEEHGRLWHESEKEVINVLNGVSTLLELNEKLGKLDTEKILQKIEDIQSKLKNIITKE